MFRGNKFSREVPQHAAGGFEKSLFTTQKLDYVAVPKTYTAGSNSFPDSVQQASKQRLGHALPATAGFSNLQLAINIRSNAYSGAGAGWLAKNASAKAAAPAAANCNTAAELYKMLEKNGPVSIKLTGREYTLDKPFNILNKLTISGDKRTTININTGKLPAVFMVMGNGQLLLKDVSINGSGVQAGNFISSDAGGSSDHYSIAVSNCSITGLGAAGCNAFFYAHKSMVADSIVLRNNSFSRNSINYIVMKDETDDKGYYNAEKIVLDRNSFTNEKGMLLNIYRGGNDESTMGPQLFVTGNQFTNCAVEGNAAFIELTGVQKTRFISNRFRDCSAGGRLFQYTDIVRADHLLEKNVIEASGAITENKFVAKRGNVIK
jgi:poly(beta-D-mannuronate) lyase